MKTLTNKQAAYLYAALMRGDLQIPAWMPEFKPGIVYECSDTGKRVSSSAISFFCRAIKALHNGNKDLAQRLFQWALEEVKHYGY